MHASNQYPVRPNAPSCLATASFAIADGQQPRVGAISCASEGTGLTGTSRTIDPQTCSARGPPPPMLAMDKLRWPRLSEQFFRVDKWSVCRG